MAKKLTEYKIDWDTLDNVSQFDVEYDDESDILFMQSKHKRAAVSIDLNGEAWIRIKPKTGEIVGVEIESFREVFLKNHPELLKTETFVKPITGFLRLEKCPA
jgi:uncharacterized protein YuzE